MITYGKALQNAHSAIFTIVYSFCAGINIINVSIKKQKPQHVTVQLNMNKHIIWDFVMLAITDCKYQDV